jgi:hypothetical protein
MVFGHVCSRHLTTIIHRFDENDSRLHGLHGLHGICGFLAASQQGTKGGHMKLRAPGLGEAAMQDLAGLSGGHRAKIRQVIYI